MAGPSTHEVPLGADEPKMVIEAFRLGLGTIRRRDYPVWFANALRDGRVYQKRNPDYPVECTIRTLEGEMDANLGDYVIRGVKGELYPCKPDIFEMTDWEARREELSRMTMRELRALAREEGVCLGYAGSCKDTALDEIVSSERYWETEGGEA